jgi:hypothetical protein
LKQRRREREVGRWLSEGRLRYRETIVDGLERAPEALVSMLGGATIGKTLVRIGADPAIPHAARGMAGRATRYALPQSFRNLLS